MVSAHGMGGDIIWRSSTRHFAWKLKLLQASTPMQLIINPGLDLIYPARLTSRLSVPDGTDK